MTNKTKSIDTERSLCIKVYTNTQSFGPALLRPPICGPSLISAPAELVKYIIENIYVLAESIRINSAYNMCMVISEFIAID